LEHTTSILAFAAESISRCNLLQICPAAVAILYNMCLVFNVQQEAPETGFAAENGPKYILEKRKNQAISARKTGCTDAGARAVSTRENAEQIANLPHKTQRGRRPKIACPTGSQDGSDFRNRLAWPRGPRASWHSATAAP
jgi:hypothetical protein